jgi:hypothetical protein
VSRFYFGYITELEPRVFLIKPTENLMLINMFRGAKVETNLGLVMKSLGVGNFRLPLRCL